MIEREIHAGISVLRMAHGKANALDLEFLDAIDGALAEEATSTERALVLTGSGSIFSAGVDLFRILKGGREYVEAFLPALERAFMRLFVLEKPVVAAVNGHAIAGGAILACGADVRLMSRGNGTFGIPELKVGVPFPPLALEIARHVLAPAELSEAVNLGRTYTVDECSARGWVSEVVAPDALLPRAIEVARGLTAVPPAAFASTKLLLRQPHLDFLHAHGARIARGVLETWRSPEVAHAIRAYVERTIKKS